MPINYPSTRAGGKKCADGIQKRYFHLVSGSNIVARLHTKDRSQRNKIKMSLCEKRDYRRLRFLSGL